MSLAVLIGAPAGAAEPSPQDREEAKRAFAQANSLAKAGKLVEALDKYRRAHELAPTPVTRLEFAKALAGQGQLVKAQALATTAAALPETETETLKSRAARKEARELAASLSVQIPLVTVRLAGATAATDASGEPEVAIDAIVVSNELLTREIPLDPGQHTIVVRQGERRAELTFALVEQERRQLDLALPPREEAAPPPIVPVRPPTTSPQPATEPVAQGLQPGVLAEPPADGIHPVVPALLIVGGVGLTLGAVTGAVAIGQAGTLKDGCFNNKCPPLLHDTLASQQAVALTSTIAFSIGGAAAAGGVIAWIVDANSGDPSGPTLQARFGGTELVLEGTW